MKLRVKRGVFNKTNILGKLFVNDEFFCYTLEDVIRDKKIMNETAIPKGDYKVILDTSVRFKKLLPLIYNNAKDLSVVANNGDVWRGIRFHGGNTEADSSGCILVANNTDNKKIWNSASDALVKKLKEATEAITLTIE